uniref:Uncharacterized protein n=1 Tax=Salix viminalis TaxID=40686 RepID=A0A6N2MXY6_SALVM
MRKIQESLRSLATKLKFRKQKKGSEKKVPTRSNHFPVYVGDRELEGNLDRYDVPVDAQFQFSRLCYVSPRISCR